MIMTYQLHVIFELAFFNVLKVLLMLNSLLLKGMHSIKALPL